MNKGLLVVFGDLMIRGGHRNMLFLTRERLNPDVRGT